MANIDDIDVPSLLWQEGSAPATPASTKWRLYFKTTGLFHKDDAGAEVGPLVSSSSSFPSGSAFPGGPSSNDLFYRNDLDLIFFYDGTRWLTMDVRTSRLVITDTLQGSNNAPVVSAPTDEGASGMWITEWVAWTFQSTGSGSAYVTWQLRSGTAAGSYSNLGSSFNTSADTSGHFVKHTVTVGAAVTSGDSHLKPLGTKTSTPTGLYIDSTVLYRLIGT